MSHNTTINALQDLQTSLRAMKPGERREGLRTAANLIKQLPSGLRAAWTRAMEEV
jgi:hypothetical protein